MNRLVNTISARMSLRPPQRESLEILARVTEIVPPDKGRSVDDALAVIRSEFPSMQSFERDFPSLCFALATGVGKTRLMGAFMTYLYLAHGLRHFFVLAPNLTIYRKLIADFTPGTSKYVLNGIAEFAAQAPEIVTGDNYENGGGSLSLFHETAVQINIFNISKINTEVRGSGSPRIRRLSEYIGQSYFDYLASLDDLVLMMDESHRYRASAGVRVLNELRPVLGLELTATPKVEAAGGPIEFKNVVYRYPLSQALTDGFVKQPAVATRENFQASAYTPEALERLKLEDGIRVHESVKVDLNTYALQTGAALVKPFMLVVAQDTTHADALKTLMEADDFFDGRYKGRVITVHSNLRGEERDETIQQLVDVENADNPTEVVVHVNKLKEGWDVRNLYTIVPLRAAKSEILTEQTIGRGLRLPYGKRTGVPAVDRLTIIAHDSFQAIIDEANNPNSIIREGIVIGRDIPIERKETVRVISTAETLISANSSPAREGETLPASRLAFTAQEQPVALATLKAIVKFERLPTAAALRTPEVQAKLVEEVKAAYSLENSAQITLPETVEAPDFAAIVARVTEVFEDNLIAIPRIVVQPRGEVVSGFRAFDLDTRAIHLQPVDQNILIKHLHDQGLYRLVSESSGAAEARPEDYLVRHLISFDDVSYDDHADLLYTLAGQCARHLASYLLDETAVINVLQFHGTRLAEIIHSQMQTHAYTGGDTDYEVTVSKGFLSLRDNSFSAVSGQTDLDFRRPVAEKQYIRGMVFSGFQCCLYPRQKFDSDSERRFAVILENEPGVRKWFKPARNVFPIFYAGDHAYEPDFVVETANAKLLCEIKRADHITSSDEVRQKAEAAALWCRRASEHELAHGGKPWSYLLLPHDELTEDKTLKALTGLYLYESV